MPNTRSSSHRKLFIVIIVAVVIIALSMASAFVWPGWALNKQASQQQQQQEQVKEPTKPAIDAVALPKDSTELLKAMPDSVLNFARTKADSSETWKSTSPLEEYTLTYSTGKKSEDITLIVGQWSVSDSAKTQYNSLTEKLTGKTLYSGAVKVRGNETGEYVVRENKENTKFATAVWYNDTVVFQATGSAAGVERFVQKFPL
ncbi:hypothetical protein KIH75_06405 [Bifidobacterium sp. 64T4]|uniref:hypothetical protein n=1 Tax=Bifidobacterium pongonis TaxID=2834432 RepID=UPI001C59D2B5|nr:hypothetical protein [Bifidobacterium pongonis]MBW3094968.1 hypothetical protein [Bifidobacterium pongonis]